MTSPENATQEDSTLVKASLSGDAQAFEVLIRRYQKLIYNIIFQMVQNHEAAADLSQETFLKAFKGLPGFHLQSKFKPWLLKIASNTTINYLKAFTNRKFQSLEEELEEHPLSEPASHTNVENEVELRISQQQLSLALQNLPQRHRQIFILRYQYDLSYADISSIVEEPESTIKSMLYRIRERLRKTLSEEPKTQVY